MYLQSQLTGELFIMAIKMNTIKCPECGAMLPIEEGRTQFFCSYCGAKIIMTNENEYTIRHIDEAQIRRAETERSIQLKKLEIIEKRRAEAKETKELIIAFAIIMVIAGVLIILFMNSEVAKLTGGALLVGAAFIGLFSIDNDKSNEYSFENKIRVPNSIRDYERKQYTEIESYFTGAGFTNVTCKPHNDLLLGIKVKQGAVEAITINGRKISGGGQKFPADIPVVITYHDFIK